MITILNKEDCCGCYACMNICPKNCIEMQADSEGFYYPAVNSELCVDCGLCEKICPSLQEKTSAEENHPTEPMAYAMINKNEEVRMDSSSGGIFTLLAEEILKNQGVVFGVAMTSDCKAAVHVEVKNSEDLWRLRGSKYLQSKVEDTYIKAKEYLEQGRQVLFSGTPCHIEGLKNYLRWDYSNLYCVDIICHGVPSQKVWEKYLEYRNRDGHSNQVSFRNKKQGWKAYSLVLKLSNGKLLSETLYDDWFMTAFLRGLSMRPSCYTCHFKKINRVSDITLADFWGIHEAIPEMDDNRGTSLVLVHSDNGKSLLDKIIQNVEMKQADFSVAKQMNPSMVKSAEKNPGREAFFKDLDSYPFDKLVQKHVPEKGTLEAKAKRIVKRIIRKLKN